MPVWQICSTISTEVTLVCHLARSARPLSSPSRIKRFTKTGTAGAGTTSKTLFAAASASSRTSLLFCRRTKPIRYHPLRIEKVRCFLQVFWQLMKQFCIQLRVLLRFLLFKSSSTMMEVTSEETTSSEVVKASSIAVMAVAPSSSTFFSVALGNYFA